MPDSLLVRPLCSGFKLEDSETSLRLDGLGRWQSFRQGRAFYRRCLNGRAVSDRGQSLLSHKKHQCILHSIQQTIAAWMCDEIDEPVRKLFRRASVLTLDDYESLGRLYAEVYPEDVPILPPDRYGDLVVQPAVGCPNRRCTFCAFYQDKPFRVLLPEQLEQHLSGIKTLMGGMPDRDGVFIGSANAMALSQRRLTYNFERIAQRLGTFKRGIAAFADPDFSAPRQRGDWNELKQLGLNQLVIGLETGWSSLRSKLGKAGDLSVVRGAVADYKAAGIEVGITVLTGACPVAEQYRHRQETSRFLSSLELERSDKVYLSPLSGSEFDSQSDQQQLRQMLRRELEAKVVPYQMQRFHYFA